MNKTQTLHSFWSGFGLKAYEENAVPDGTVFPYLTYEAGSDSFDHKISLTASLWYRSSSWWDATQKEQEIADFITRGGRMVAYDNGAMWIQRGTPWSQRMGDQNDDMVKRIIMNIELEYLD